MCGIAGIIDFSSQRPSETTLRKMLGLLRHRGPDAFGIYTDDAAGLAHARLSILDLETGDQPIHNEDRSVWIVFNGEIFNEPALRERLLQKGHRFYTRTDTEVLVHLYEDEGPDFLHRLNGQFAFAIWDQRKKALFLARDRVGIRPLFYHLNRKRLVFGSEIKALFADQGIPRRIDPGGLSEVFTFWAPVGERTAFDGVRQIEPGHFVVFSKNGLKTKCYWQPRFPFHYDENRTLDDWTDALGELLRDAARIRLRADVPVGAYLSGGLDSTYISSIIRRHFNNRLHTFSVTFTNRRFDEKSFQDTALAAINTEHRFISCSERQLGEDFPQVVWHAETPILRTAPAPLFRLSHLVRESGYKVVLTGEGADEVFAGYNIFKEDRVRRFWAKRPESRLRPLLLKRLYPYVFSRINQRAARFLESYFKHGLTELDVPTYSHMIRWHNTVNLMAFYSEPFKESCPDPETLIEAYIGTLPRDFMSWDPLSRAQYIEMDIFLSNYLLSSQGDRMAMGHSVEGRFPFLDHRVIEFAATIPPQYRLNGLKGKYVLKKAAGGVVPPELINRPKQPYRAPIGKCFLGDDVCEYVRELLSDDSIRQAGYFDPKKVRQLVMKGKKQGGDLAGERDSMALVGILSTQLLHHQFIRNFPPYPIREPEVVAVENVQK